jgi:hypothetical protein
VVLEKGMLMTKITSENNAPETQDNTKIKSTEPCTSVTEWLETQHIGARNKELELCKQVTALGYVNITSLEQIMRIKPDTDPEQDIKSIESTLAIQRDAKELFETKQHLAFVVPIEQSKLHLSVDAAEKVLAQRPELNIFKRRGMLIRVLKYEFPDTSNPQENVSIIEIEHKHLILILTQHGNFIKYDKRSKRIEEIDCPEKIATSLLAKHDWKSLRNLCGIITTPTLRSDGSILESHGYDEASGLLFIPDNCIVPKIPEYPTPEELDRAQAILCAIFSEFPFEGANDGDASRSVMIAAIITGLIRHMLPTAPIFAITAPKMASGKTLLADLVGIIVTGKSNSVLAPAENETEEKKRLFTLLRELTPIICYDNISKPFGSTTLCAITTQDRYKDRVLGISGSQAVSTRTTILFTGNNLTLVGDLTSRTVLCKLNPNVERPGDRIFKIKNIRQHVLNNRGDIIWAALTLIRSYYAADKPAQDIPPFARFEAWSNIVRSTLVWRGMADPCANRDAIESSDPIQSSLEILFSALYEEFGEIPFQASDISKIINTRKDEIANKLSDAMHELCGSNVKSTKIGSQLRTYKDRIEGGIRLVKSGEIHGTTLWKVMRVEN